MLTEVVIGLRPGSKTADEVKKDGLEVGEVYEVPAVLFHKKSPCRCLYLLTSPQYSRNQLKLIAVSRGRLGLRLPSGLNDNFK